MKSLGQSHGFSDLVLGLALLTKALSGLSINFNESIPIVFGPSLGIIIKKFSIYIHISRFPKTILLPITLLL